VAVTCLREILIVEKESAIQRFNKNLCLLVMIVSYRRVRDMASKEIFFSDSSNITDDLMNSNSSFRTPRDKDAKECYYKRYFDK